MYIASGLEMWLICDNRGTDHAEVYVTYPSPFPMRAQLDIKNNLTLR